MIVRRYTAVLCSFVVAASSLVFSQDETSQPEQPRSPGLWEIFTQQAAAADAGEVLVTANRLRGEGLSLERTPASVSVFNRADVERTNTRTVPEFLQNDLGTVVYDQTGNGYEWTLDLRGFGSGKNTTVLLDGAPVNRSNSRLVDWPLLPFESIDSIEVMRGSNSILGGRGAQAGVINLGTAIPRRQGLSLTAQVGGGEHGYFKTTELAQWRNANGLFYLGDATHEEGATFRHNSDFRRTGTFNKVGLERDNFLIWISHTHENSTFQQPGGALGEHLGADWEFSRKLRPDRRRFNHHHSQVNVEWDVTDNFDLGFLLYHRDSDSQIINIFGSDGAFGGGDQSFSDNVTGFTLQAAHHFRNDWADNQLAFGVENHKTRFQTATHTINGAGDRVADPFNPDPLSSVRDDRYFSQGNFSFFIDDNLLLFNCLTLSAGYRGDQSDIEFTNLLVHAFDNERTIYRDSFKVGATLNVPYIDGLNVYGVYSEGFRIPDLSELYVFSAFPGAGDNPLLDPEQSENTEFGLRYRWRNVVEFTAAHFDAKTDDEIQLVSLPLFVLQNQNVGETRRKGWELSLKARTTNWLDVWANYTKTDGKFTDGIFPKGNAVPFAPTFVYSAGINARFLTYFEFSTDLRRTGPRELDGNQFNFSPRIDDYTTWNAKLTARWKNWEGYVGVNNILDRRYEAYGVRAFDFDTFATLDFFIPAAPREFFFGLQYAVDF